MTRSQGTSPQDLREVLLFQRYRHDAPPLWLLLGV